MFKNLTTAKCVNAQFEVMIDLTVGEETTKKPVTVIVTDQYATANVTVSEELQSTISIHFDIASEKINLQLNNIVTLDAANSIVEDLTAKIKAVITETL